MDVDEKATGIAWWLLGFVALLLLLKEPGFSVSSLYLKKPERIMALLMVMTICLLVISFVSYAARGIGDCLAL
jgi:transposase